MGEEEKYSVEQIEERFMTKQFAGLQMERPMDSMKVVGLSSPFEDEFAIANLSGLSPYMGAIFPRQYHYYERGAIGLEKTITFFFKKVLYRQQDKRLILKSPSHTARVRVLRELFPGAKFIHI
ncbi:hypothetical protein NGA_0201600, partial [Nannochloropsis gaditana CCMP526]|uniref:uncharacterized protein n=1 Tax=Nannochloropsis gaditana (strain CCMP526) TaxID=1093141 RepID=UPI00029F6D21